MTTQTVPVSVDAHPVVTWLRTGLRRRPLAHAMSAFLVATLFTWPAQYSVIAFIFGGFFGLWAAALVLIVSGIAFGALGRIFLRSRRGWLLGLVTPIVWLPIVVVAFMQTAEPTGSLDGTSITPLLIGSSACALIALVTYAGPLRVLAITAACICAIVLILHAMTERASDELAEGQARFGSSVRPFVAVIDGYRSLGEPTATAAGAVAGFYREQGAEQTGPAANPTDITLATETDATSGISTACGPPLLGTDGDGAPQDQLSCTQNGNTWTRKSANGHELARILDGYIVRVSASMEVSTSTLEMALDAAHPMDDRFYRHLLFGEQGEYIPELDGKR